MNIKDMSRAQFEAMDKAYETAKREKSAKNNYVSMDWNTGLVEEFDSRDNRVKVWFDPSW